MEDPTPPLDTPEVFGGLKTRLFEGPKLIGSVWEVTKETTKKGPAGGTTGDIRKKRIQAVF